MATNNVVDTLEIEIQASAKGAIDSLSKLETRLRGLASATKNLSGAVNNITRLSTALSNFKSVNTNKFNKLNDISINQKTIVSISQMADAINKLNGVNLSGATFTPLVKVVKELNGIDIDPTLGHKIQLISQGMSTLNNVNFKGTSFTPAVNAIANLASVKFDASSLGNISMIANELLAFSKVPDVSSAVTRLVTALAKLGAVGTTIKQTQSELPNFANSIKHVATVLSQLGGVSPQITGFISSLGQLAASGTRMPEAARNLIILGDGLKRLIEDLSKAPQVSANVTALVGSISQMAAALGSINRSNASSTRGVTKQVSAIGSAFKTLAPIVKKVTGQILSLFQTMASRIGAFSKSVISNILGIKESSKHMYSVSDGIKSVIGGLLGMKGITGIFNWAKDAVTAGGDITEIDHIVKSVFAEDMVDSVNTWANNAIEKFGIAAGSAKQYAGTLAAMFQSSNVGVEESGKMAMNLVGLAGDLSAFYNIDTQTAYEKLKSGMAGMVRPLRDLGIDLSVATLQEYALSQGITKSVTSMTQAEKVMLRYNYLMSHTTTQQGDFQRTNLSLANSLRTLRAYASAVSTQIGVGFAAAIRHVIILLNTLLKGLLRLAQGFATVMQAIFGKYEGGASGIAMEGLGDAADYAEDLGDSSNDAASGLSDASDAAKKLKKDLSVLPFDELNQLNKDRESTSSGKGGSGDGGGIGDLGEIGDLLDLEDAITNSRIPDAIEAWGNRIRNAFLAHNWFALGRDIAELLNRGLEKIYELLDPEAVREKVEPFITGFAATFNSLVDHLNFDLIGSIIGRGLTDIAMLFNIWYDNMNLEHLGEQLSEAVNGFFADADFVEIGNALGNQFMVGWDIFRGFVTNEQMWINLGNAIADGIRGLNEKIRLGDIGSALASLANGLCDALASFTENAPWEDIRNNIVDGITRFMGEVKWSENAEKLERFLKRLCSELVLLISDIPWENIGKQLATTLASIPWDDVKKVAAAILDALGKFIKGLISEPEGAVAVAIVAGLGALNIFEKLSRTALGNLIVKAIAKSITNAGTSGTGGIALQNAVKGLFSSSAMLAAVGEAGALLGLVVAAQGISKVVDSARGGNGVITQFGTAVDSVIQSLVDSNKVTSEQANELFRLKEAGESAGDSQEQIASTIIAKLGEYGISADNARLAIDGLTIAGNNEASAMAILSQAASEAAATTDGLSSSQLMLNGHSLTAQQAISQLKSALYDARTETDEFAGQYDLAREVLSNSTSDIYSAEDAYRIIINSMGEGSEAANAFKEYLSSLGYSFEETERKAGTSGSNITTNMANGIGDFTPIRNKMAEIQNSFASTWSNIRQNSAIEGEATARGYGNAFANQSELSNNLNKTQSLTSTAFTAIQKAAEAIGNNTKKGVLHGLTTHLTGLEDTTGRMMSQVNTTRNDIEKAMNIDLSGAGYKAAQSFANGFRAVHIPTPHIYTAGYDTFYFGDGGYSSIPYFGVQWYKAGGLFNGGKGQIIGVGEDNRDEAVLPLENRRAMSRIAESIVNSSAGSGIGISKNDIIEAAAQAIIMTQGSQSDPIFHVEVKTENDEVLARAVTRGQRSIDYRNNPTPQMAY